MTLWRCTSAGGRVVLVYGADLETARETAAAWLGVPPFMIQAVTREEQ